VPILQTNARVVLAVMLSLFAMAEVVAQSRLPELPPLTSGAAHETRTPASPGLSAAAPDLLAKAR
jgi:hypothetical protein